MPEQSQPTHDIVLPQLGSGPLTVKVSSWFVEIGDVVCAGDRILELQLPGMTFDVSAPCSGRILEILVPVGTVVTEQMTLARIREDGD